MASLNVGDSSVTGDIGDHFNADTLEIFADQPDFTGQIKIAQDINGMFGDIADVAHAD